MLGLYCQLLVFCGCLCGLRLVSSSIAMLVRVVGSASKVVCIESLMTTFTPSLIRTFSLDSVLECADKYVSDFS